MAKQVLLVESDGDLVKMLVRRIRQIADVDAHTDFESARARLTDRPYDFIIANVQVGDHTGLELVELAALSGTPARSIVYSDAHDPMLARRIQGAGAFYETRRCSPFAVPSFLQGDLPDTDRRNAAVRDRRRNFRGGRRAWDRVPDKSA